MKRKPSFSEYLTFLREKLAYQQNYIAKLTVVDKGSYSRYESGKLLPPGEFINNFIGQLGDQLLETEIATLRDLYEQALLRKIQGKQDSDVTIPDTETPSNIIEGQNEKFKPDIKSTNLPEANLPTMVTEVEQFVNTETIENEDVPVSDEDLSNKVLPFKETFVPSQNPITPLTPSDTPTAQKFNFGYIALWTLFVLILIAILTLLISIFPDNRAMSFITLDDLQTYCQSHNYQTVSQENNSPYSWYCKNNAENLHLIDFDQVCREQSGNDTPYGVLINPNASDGWQCFSARNMSYGNDYCGITSSDVLLQSNSNESTVRVTFALPAAVDLSSVDYYIHIGGDYIPPEYLELREQKVQQNEWIYESKTLTITSAIGVEVPSRWRLDYKCGTQ